MTIVFILIGVLCVGFVGLSVARWAF